MEETKRGRSTHQIPIMSEKLAHVMVLIQRATAAMVKIEADKGNQPEMMSAFELEGVISLPNTGIAKFINVLAKGLEVPKLSGHWAATIYEFLENARWILNDQMGQ